VATDSYLLYAEEYVPRLVAWNQALGTQASDPAAVQRGVDVLASGWDYVASVESREAWLFTHWARLMKSQLQLPYPAPPDDTISDQAKLTSLNLLGRAVTELESAYGRPDPLYGNVHRIRRGDLNVPAGGSEGLLQALFLNTTELDADYIGYAWGGSSYHMLTELRPDGVTAVSVKPWGQSDDPASSHYNDLTEVYAQGLHKPFWFERADVEANLESRTELPYNP
jgi:penicillin amidase/acyl-homoserine-lactone acylase